MRIFTFTFACAISSWFSGSAVFGQSIDETVLLDLERTMVAVEQRIRAKMPFLPSGAEAAIYSDVSQCMTLAYKLGLQGYTQALNGDLVSSIDRVSRGLPISSPEDPIMDAYYVAVWWSVLTQQLLAISELEADVAQATWDLNCAGREFISNLPPYRANLIDASSRIQRGSRDAFARVEGHKITVLGEITDGFSDRLKGAFSSISDPSETVVSLGSGGGNVGEAVRAARFIRKVGASTEIYNTCESACPLVFLGGVERDVWHPAPDIGFHMLSIDGAQPIEASHPLYLQIRDFVEEMGVDGEKYVGFMMEAPPSSMFYPGIMALCDAGVVTWAQRQC